ncbi:MAG: LacI family DNA-binding transcriptional regulator [Sedimentisphaerales bacterium]|nr:LacI family DNA-binding transcriptional regulator [Sedimentisphaerales bacterium]
MAKSSSRITLKDIARDVGVSTTTVSRVLAGKARKYRICDQTAKKVLSSAKKHNFKPNLSARALKLRKTYTIGVVVSDITNPFFASIAQSIELEARKQDYAIVLCDSGEDIFTEIECVELLRNRDVDGLIVSPVGEESNHLENICKEKLPLVLLDRYFPDLTIPYVACDSYTASQEAVSYLIKCGHHKIACIQGRVETISNKNRIAGYKKALRSNGIKLNNNFIIGDDFGEASGYLSMKLLLNQSPAPTAVLALSNPISLGALRAIREKDLKIPDDISIIAFDEQLYSKYLATPMTTIEQKNSEMGQVAVQLLIKQIKAKRYSSNKGILLPCNFIQRDSVKILK